CGSARSMGVIFTGTSPHATRPGVLGRPGENEARTRIDGDIASPAGGVRKASWTGALKPTIRGCASCPRLPVMTPLLVFQLTAQIPVRVVLRPEGPGGPCAPVVPGGPAGPAGPGGPAGPAGPVPPPPPVPLSMRHSSASVIAWVEASTVRALLSIRAIPAAASADGELGGSSGSSSLSPTFQFSTRASTTQSEASQDGQSPPSKRSRQFELVMSITATAPVGGGPAAPE